jgi:hypothetical protein
MAHQAHNIPWHSLADNFEYVFSNDRHGSITNLYPRNLPKQSGNLKYFVEAFARNVEAHSTTSRPQYATSEKPPERDDVVISDAFLSRMSPFLKYVIPQETSSRSCLNKSTTFDPERRKMSAFLQQYRRNDCYEFYETNGQAYAAFEVLQLALMLGEMDTVLRMCSHPDTDYLKWWRMAECYDATFNLGWEMIPKRALEAYICMNVFYCYPSLWNITAGRTKERDYRRTKAYQETLRACTEAQHPDIPLLPHRRFFGIIDTHFNGLTRQNRAIWHERGLCPDGDYWARQATGILTLEDFLALEHGPYHLPTDGDTKQVKHILRSFGLPAELQLRILELAEYDKNVPRRLSIPHDPLRPENREELQKYLKYCWTLLVNCDMMAKALGDRIPWQALITITIIRLFGTELSERDEYNRIREPGDPWTEPQNKMYRLLDIEEQLEMIDGTSHIQCKEESDSFRFVLI